MLQNRTLAAAEPYTVAQIYHSHELASFFDLQTSRHPWGIKGQSQNGLEQQYSPGRIVKHFQRNLLSIVEVDRRGADYDLL